MKISRLWGAACACLSIVSFNASAIIVDNGTYTTVDGVDWLDLTATAGMSYNQVSAQLGPGGTFDGWTYATGAQVEGLWTAFGGDAAYYNGWSTQNNGLFDVIAPLMGDLHCAINACSPGEGYSYWLTADVAPSGWHVAAQTYDLASQTGTATYDWFNTDEEERSLTDARTDTGSALIRTSAVPLPAAVWLFGTGLLGLFGVARRKVRG
jgi:hypothetical protein